MSNLSFFALIARPFEVLCAEEIEKLPGATAIKVVAGGVRFRGSAETLYQANLWLRTASRVLQILDDFPCADAKELYDHARQIPWETWFKSSDTFVVHAQGQSEELRNSMFTAMRVKDAVADRFRDLHGVRPSVDTDDPTVVVHVQLYPRREQTYCSISLDSSGTPLHQRGYRNTTGEAPLKETLAATLLMACGYQGETLVDPFCGSGTLVIEAAMIATHTAPGLSRNFGFQRWQNFDAKLFDKVKESAEQKKQVLEQAICFGSDVDQRAVIAARRNAKMLSPTAYFRQTEIEDVLPPEGKTPGLVICNPPYGLRLSNLRLPLVYKKFGQVLRQEFRGWRVAVLTTAELGPLLEMRPAQRISLHNGELDVELWQFVI